MSRIVSVVLALLLVLTCLSAAAEPLLPIEVLGGTSWRSPDGVEFHFTGDAGVFFSYDSTQPLYRRIGTDLYMSSPSTDPCGPFLVLDSARRCTFALDGVTLLMDDPGDDAAPVAFTYISYPTLLAGTRWLDEHGTIFEFSADGLEFTCGCYGMLFARTLSSLGAYYEMSPSRQQPESGGTSRTRPTRSCPTAISSVPMPRKTACPSSGRPSPASPIDSKRRTTPPRSRPPF